MAANVGRWLSTALAKGLRRVSKNDPHPSISSFPVLPKLDLDWKRAKARITILIRCCGSQPPSLNQGTMLRKSTAVPASGPRELKRSLVLHRSLTNCKLPNKRPQTANVLGSTLHSYPCLGNLTYHLFPEGVFRFLWFLM